VAGCGGGGVSVPGVSVASLYILIDASTSISIQKNMNPYPPVDKTLIFG
jgi:hypothetical protein